MAHPPTFLPPDPYRRTSSWREPTTRVETYQCFWINFSAVTVKAETCVISAFLRMLRPLPNRIKVQVRQTSNVNAPPQLLYAHLNHYLMSQFWPNLSGIDFPFSSGKLSGVSDDFSRNCSASKIWGIRARRTVAFLPFTIISLSTKYLIRLKPVLWVANDDCDSFFQSSGEASGRNDVSMHSRTN